MTDKEIYNLWLSLTPDLRYLRPRRWKQLRALIEAHRLLSILEFGSGVSTLLFDNLQLKIHSYETNAEFIDFVKPHCSARVKFFHWNNKQTEITNRFDLALIDGILPREPQLAAALGHAHFYALDDCERSTKAKLIPFVSEFIRIDDHSTSMAIFEDRSYVRA
jgi:hypothetical protein